MIGFLKRAKSKEKRSKVQFLIKEIYLSSVSTTCYTIHVIISRNHTVEKIIANTKSYI